MYPAQSALLTRRFHSLYRVSIILLLYVYIYLTNTHTSISQKVHHLIVSRCWYLPPPNRTWNRVITSIIASRNHSSSACSCNWWTCPSSRCRGPCSLISTSSWMVFLIEEKHSCRCTQACSDSYTRHHAGSKPHWKAWRFDQNVWSFSSRLRCCKLSIHSEPYFIC